MPLKSFQSLKQKRNSSLFVTSHHCLHFCLLLVYLSPIDQCITKQENFRLERLKIISHYIIEIKMLKHGDQGYPKCHSYFSRKTGAIFERYWSPIEVA